MEERTTGVPFQAHEADMARMERSNHRFFIVVVVLIILLFGTNAAWLAYETQFEEVVTTVEATADTGTAIANASGEVNFNDSESESNGQNAAP